MARAAVTWVVRDGRSLWDGRTLLEWTGELVDELVRLFDPVEVWLFGSVSRGDDGPDSDIDLLVVLDHYDATTAVQMKQRAASDCSVPVPFDVAFSDTGRLTERRRIPGTLERAAVTEGRLVHRRV